MIRLVRALLASHRARRDYRALCRQGRAPVVRYEITLMTDQSDDWTGLSVPGITGIKTMLPLTPAGIRLIKRDAQRIRKTCVRQLLLDQLADQDSTHNLNGDHECPTSS